MVFFDETTSTAALAELDARYFAGEGAAHRDMLLAGGKLMTASARNDFDTVRELLAPDFVVVDHQLLGFGQGDRDEYIAGSRSRTQVATDGTSLMLSLEIVGRAVLISQLQTSITQEGSQYERHEVVVTVFDESNQVVRQEWYPIERYADARARLEELGAPPTWPPYLDNTACRLITSGSDTDISADISADVIIDDRRRGVSLPPLHGADAFIENTQIQEEMFGPTALEPVATRGDRLVLARTLTVAASGFELVAYGVFETNEAGQFCAAVMFDETDRDRALRELDRRYLVGEGAADLEMLLVGGKFAAANASNDLDAQRELLAPDFVVVDHHLLRFGQGDREYFIEGSRSRTQVAADGTSLMLSLEVVGRAVLIARRSTSVTPDGSEYERHEFVVTVFDASNHVSRLEWYPIEHYAEARARLDELGAPPVAAPPIENAADAPRPAVRRALGTGSARRSERVRRASCSLASITGRSSRRPTPSGARSSPVRPEPLPTRGTPPSPTRPIAVRGERLCLGINTYRNDSGFTTQYLVLVEFDADDRMVRVENYDESDLDAALDALDALYIAGEGAEHERLLRLIGDCVYADREHDAAAWEGLLLPGLVAFDRRRTGAPDVRGARPARSRYGTTPH